MHSDKKPSSNYGPQIDNREASDKPTDFSELCKVIENRISHNKDISCRIMRSIEKLKPLPEEKPEPMENLMPSNSIVSFLNTQVFSLEENNRFLEKLAAHLETIV